MMGVRYLVRLLLACALAVLAPLARADAPVVLFKSYAGHLNFTGTEATMRTSGTNVCSVVKKNTTLYKTLSGLPSGAVIKAAYLYWAGSGSTDYQVSFQGATINAQRKYTGSYTTGGVTYNYFAGVTDVTSVVAAKGNGTYSFGGLTVNSGSPYCTIEGVLGGFALLVVYEKSTEPFRVLNLYEGFQYTRNSSLTLSLSNFRVPDPIGSNTGRIGHITWEGDQSLTQQGENLSFNGTILTDSMNPAGNQFDSKSNIDGDGASYGIDFDAYTIGYPVIKSGDSTASTVYASGQDLVWLNAEIVAVPNVPTVDRAIAITRAGDPLQGVPVSYSLSVSNNGPDPESGAMTVSAQVTTGTMLFSGASGNGWTCTVGSTSLTCSYTGTLSANSSLPAITVTGAATSNGDVAVTATVDGPTFDNVSGNNTAVDVYTDTSSTDPYAFTVKQCVAGYAFGDPLQPCTRFDGKFIAGTSQQLYVTAMSNGRPTAKFTSGGSPSAFTFYFSVTCMNPTAASTLAINFAGAQMRPCYGSAAGAMPPSNNSAWSNGMSLWFDKGAASNNTPLTFTWPDVGLVRLNLMDASARTASTRVVSAPKSVKFVVGSIKNSDGGVNPAGAGWFAKAGESFNVSVQVLNGATTPIVPPNFGHEDGPYGPLGVTVGLPASVSANAAAFSALAGNAYPGTVSYSGVGSVAMKATIQGTNTTYAEGTYFGSPVETDLQTVGNFYPAYFETDTLGGMVCLPRMNCPTGKTALGDDLEVTGAYYSGQPFASTVAAFNKGGANLTGLLKGLGSAFTIALNPYSQPGAGGAAVTVKKTETNTVSSDATPTATNDALPLQPKVYLEHEFDRSVAATSWSAPTTAYMRAEVTFNRVAASGTILDKVTSSRSGVPSREGGVQLVAGRLKVSNAFGSELLKLPLPLRAQYWSGTGWENNTSDDDTVVSAASFPLCRGRLVLSGTSCNLALVKPVTTPINVPFNDGLGTLWLQAPGAGNTGRANVAIDGATPGVPHIPYLPSTVGQATFGVYKSPLIYVREVY